MINFQKFFTALIAAGLAVLAQTTSANSDDEPEWQYTLHHLTTGDIKVYLSKHACRSVWLGGLTQLIAAPKYEVIRFQPDSKLEWRGKLNEINGLDLSRDFHLTDFTFYQRDAKYPWSKCGTGERNGWKCTKWIKKVAPDHIFWTADDIKVDPQITEFMCRCLKLPLVPGTLVYVENLRWAKQAKRPVETGSMKRTTVAWSMVEDLNSFDKKDVKEVQVSGLKKVPFNAADFQEPKGFKRVVSPDDILFGKSQTKQMLDMFDETDGIGFAPNPKKAEKKR